MSLRTRLILIFIVVFIGVFAMLQVAQAWDHAVIMNPHEGATYTVPLTPGLPNCVYVTNCKDAIDPPPALPPTSASPTPRGASGWSFGVPIDRTDWTATAYSEEVGHEASNVLDGDTATIWHTQYTGSVPGYPHQIIIDMQTVHWVDSLIYTPRTDGPNGQIAGYEVWVSLDGNVYGRVANGTNASIEKTILFSIPNKARYIKLIAQSEINGKLWATAAEIEVTESVKDAVISPGGFN